MDIQYSEEAYNEMIAALFRRFPSFQKVGAGAYKPGTDNMVFFDQLAGHPHRKYKTIHIAGTNGKGSVSNMLASALSACGLKVGLYTSPHILDFRERMRIIDGSKSSIRNNDDLQSKSEENAILYYISKEEVWDFWKKWGETADHLDLSFFEITTMMAFCWFAEQEVDVAVIETGLGGRLDSTNIIVPVLDVITNIGLDHCDMLGNTLSEIAFEKAGIIKPKVPVVVGESHPETDQVFERKVLYTNLPEPDFAGDRTRIMSLLVFADKISPVLWERHEEILASMDLQGEYQRKNLRTVLAALEVLLNDDTIIFGAPRPFHGHPIAVDGTSPQFCGEVNAREVYGDEALLFAIENTARRMEFHGRWEKLCDAPYTICDIGHNAHGLKYNFAQLERMMQEGRFKELIMVFGCVADKDTDAVLRLLPEGAHYVFTNAEGKRALPADVLAAKYRAVCEADGRDAGDVSIALSVKDAVDMARGMAGNLSADGPASDVLVYIGGSTYVVSEATATWSSRT